MKIRTALWCARLANLIALVAVAVGVLFLLDAVRRERLALKLPTCPSSVHLYGITAVPGQSHWIISEATVPVRASWQVVPGTSVYVGWVDAECP